jgi:Tfp pilus assembly protein FimT
MSAAGNKFPNRRPSGFTLLETLVMVAVAAMISALVVPNMMSALDTLTLQETTRLLQADLRVARGTAIRTGQKVDIEATNQGREYDWIGGTRTMPPGLRVAMSRPLVVYPDGSVATAAITIASSRRQYAIAVDPVNGAVTLVQR